MRIHPAAPPGPAFGAVHNIGGYLSAAGTALGGISSLINAANGGSGGSPSGSGLGSTTGAGGFGLGAQPSAGAGLADLYGFFAPLGNELSGLGITNTDYQPVSGVNLSNPGSYGLSVKDTSGTLSGGGTSASNPFSEALPSLMTEFGNIASGAKSAGQQFLENVTGGPGGSSPLLAPLNEIEMARQKATSDIEGSLSERGLSGSSFATNAIANSDATFGNAASQAALQLSQGVFSNELQSLNAQSGAIQQQSTLANQELSRELQQLQLEGTVGADLSGALTRNSSTLAQLAAAAAAGRAHALSNAGFNLGPLVGGTLEKLGGSLSGLGGTTPTQPGQPDNTIGGSYTGGLQPFGGATGYGYGGGGVGSYAGQGLTASPGTFFGQYGGGF